MAFSSRSLSRIVPVLRQGGSGLGSEMDNINEHGVRSFYEDKQPRLHFSGAVRKFAYRFDGNGLFVKKERDLMKEQGE